MTLELYAGYLSLGGNEIINNERTRGILEGLDCPADWFRDDDSRCPTLQNALHPPVVTPWLPAGENLMTDPSLEQAGATVEVLRNYVKVPILSTGHGSWTKGSGVTATPHTTGIDLDFTTDFLSNNRFFYRPTTDISTGGVGQVWSAIAIVANEGATTLRIQLELYWTTGGGGSLASEVVELAAGAGSIVRFEGLTLPAGGPSTFGIAFRNAAGSVIPAGSKLHIQDSVVATRSPNIEGTWLWNGGSPAEDDFTYAWAGTVNNSDSLRNGVGVPNASYSTSRARVYRTKDWALQGDTSAVVWPRSLQYAGAMEYTVPGGFTPGAFYTIAAQAYIPYASDTPDDADQGARAISYYTVGVGYARSSKFPNEEGIYDVRLTFQATADSTIVFGGERGVPIYWDMLTLVQVPSLEEPYAGPLFDGNTAPPNIMERYAWLGAVDASKSTREIRTLVTAPPYAETSVADAPWYDLDAPMPSGDFFGAYALEISSTSDSTRQTDVSESILNGGTIGRTRLATRSVRVRAMLFARNSAGLEYGRAWLDSATQPGACGQHGTRCGVTDVQFLADCPPSLDGYPLDGEGYNEDVDALVRFLHAVKVTSGPFTVEEFRFERNGFLSQIVEFTISSERAYVYGRTRPVVLPTSESSVVQDIPYNLVPYPSAELAGADVTIATNLSTNPSVETNTTGWVVSGSPISGTDPTAYLSYLRTTELAAVGAASLRARLLGNGSTEVASSRANVFATQDVTIPAGARRRVSLNVWGGAIIAAGAAVSVVNGVTMFAQFYDAGNVIIGSSVPIGSAGPTELSGRAYSVKSVAVPDLAVKVRVVAQFDLTWRSSATAANNSDIRAYVDALAVSIP